MASAKDLKKRIGTVKSTQQTTRAMKMVSAAKLRRAQEAIQNQRPYAKKVSQLIQNLSSLFEDTSPYPVMRKFESTERKKKVLLVTVASDRGLCGGFNSNVIRAAQKHAQSLTEAGSEVEFAFVGKRGNDFFKLRKVNISAFYSDLGGKVTFAKAKKLADTLVGRFLNEEVDEIQFIYNEFKNAVTQRPIVEDFLPLQKSAEAKEGQPAADSLANFLVKPSPKELLQELLAKNFSIQVFRILLESQAGEHGARMSAMENATKNAGEMIKKLTLQYNNKRQAGITKELLEIISGSESQKG